MQSVVDEYTNGNVKIDAPFLTWSKKMVYEYSICKNVPIDITYSCELNGSIPCGQCASCLDRKELYETSAVG
jgi:7-cyano-7-deazaguanine synthase